MNFYRKRNEYNYRPCAGIIIFLLSGFLNCALAQEIDNSKLPGPAAIESQQTGDQQLIDLTEILLEQDQTPQNYSLSLKESINFALENNSVFNIQKKQTTIYKMRLTKSILDFLPTFNTRMTYSYQTNIAEIDDAGTYVIPGFGPIAFSGFEVEKNWKRENTVSAFQPITGLYERYHRKKIAELSFDKALLEEQLSAEGIVVSLYNVYFDVLTSRYQLEACKKNVEELQSHYDMAMARYEDGTALKRDAQKVKVDLDKARYQVFVKENDLLHYMNKMKNILGISQNDRLEVKTNYDSLSNNLNADEAVTIALENNKKLKQSALDIKIARHLKKEEYTRYIPEVNVGATYLNQQGSEFYPDNNFMLSFNMNFDFFDWGKRELTIKEKQLQIEQSKLAYQNDLENLEIEVKDKYNDLKEAEMLIKVASDAVELAERNLEISSNRYKIGMELITEVLGDQSDLLVARSEYYQSLFNQQKMITRLQQSMGILFIEEQY